MRLEIEVLCKYRSLRSAMLPFIPLSWAKGECIPPRCPSTHALPRAVQPICAAAAAYRHADMHTYSSTSADICANICCAQFRVYTFIHALASDVLCSPYVQLHLFRLHAYSWSNNTFSSIYSYNICAVMSIRCIGQQLGGVNLLGTSLLASPLCNRKSQLAVHVHMWLSAWFDHQKCIIVDAKTLPSAAHTSFRHIYAHHVSSSDCV